MKSRFYNHSRQMNGHEQSETIIDNLLIKRWRHGDGKVMQAIYFKLLAKFINRIYTHTFLTPKFVRIIKEIKRYFIVDISFHVYYRRRFIILP